MANFKVKFTAFDGSKQEDVIWAESEQEARDIKIEDDGAQSVEAVEQV